MNKKRNINNIGPHIKLFNPYHPPGRRRIQPRQHTNEDHVSPKDGKTSAPDKPRWNKSKPYRSKWFLELKNKLHPREDIRELCAKLISSRRVYIKTCVDLIKKLIEELETKNAVTEKVDVIKTADTTTDEEDQLKRLVFWIERCVERVPGQKKKKKLIRIFHYTLQNAQIEIQKKLLDELKNCGKYDDFRKMGIIAGVEEEEEKIEAKEEERCIYQFAFFYDEGEEYLVEKHLIPDDEKLSIFTYDSIAPGRDINVAIEDAIQSTQQIVVMMTKKYIRSTQCYRIFALLTEMKKKNVIVVVNKHIPISHQWRQCVEAIYNISSCRCPFVKVVQMYRNKLFARIAKNR